MKKRTKHIFASLILVALTGGFATVNAILTDISSEFPEVALAPEVNAKDTTLRYPVSPIVPEKYEDITNSYPVDLRTPQNLSKDFEYNPLTNRYELRTQMGGVDMTTPISITQEEYIQYSLQKSMNSYFRSKNDEEFQNQGGKDKKDVLSGFDFQFDLGPAEKIFGPGGVRLQAQGSATIKAAVDRTVTGDPTKTERQRNRTSFDFDTQIQAGITASVGDKINFDLNYNTEATFDFDTKKIKLAYEGKEDEIIKKLEAGNVSMTTTNSLIRGGASLFGIKTELQFGKLSVGALFSQQESRSNTTSSRGNVQVTPFEMAIDIYDENMHYFLGHYFHDTYDNSMKTLPLISSGVSIDQLEVWVTNKRSDYDQNRNTIARNIVAFADLGEHNRDYFSNPSVNPLGTEEVTRNGANDLYSNLINLYPDARDISSVNQTLSGVFEGGKDYEKIENARKLDPNEYYLNAQLGYISLRMPLQPDEVLAVSYSYRYKGDAMKVGEFSNDNPDSPNQTLFLKLLKGTTNSPSSATWHLMMRNVYTISNQTIEKEKFRLDIKYKNDTTGIYLNYLTEGAIANKTLLWVENLDRLDSRNEPYSDGFFDFVEGFTVFSQTGKIVFPVVEPFGSHLRKKIGNDAIADRYVFQELYDSTLTVARQLAEKNKFILQGEYKGSGGSNINLDGYNVARGSVTVSANGRRLTENVDYFVDYTTGSVTVTNPAYDNADIQIASESQSMFGMQRRTMMGLNLNYAFSPTFNIGATIMNMSEMPMTLKTLPGEESIDNTLFGFNTNYSTSSHLLTNILDKLPFVELTAPSQITFSAEYAQLIPGHYHSKYGGDYSYIDEFERAKITLDLRTPYSWNLSSTPSTFDESKLVNDIDYGKNRALLAWYYIDGLFTRKSSLTPSHIKNDLDQLSNHYIREIQETELFPNKDQRYDEASTIPAFNLAFYPQERGPYNLDADGMNPDGTLQNPKNRWGGISRKIESGQTDFEAGNVEHIEFWLLDPFIYEPASAGGELYFNLGEISEDILKDERKFFENGMPADGDRSKVEETVWGYVPKQQSFVYAFTEGARDRQDVGLNGLSTEEELNFPTYRTYLEKLRNKLNPDVVQSWENDVLSPLRDPSGDTYHYFRGSDYDQQQLSVLERYKHYNGTEGNSADANNSGENYNTSARVNPDIEDINQDNTLNENEKYFQYKISIRPQDLQVGRNYIVDKRETTPLLKNGKKEKVNWYLFKIPIQEYEKKVGDIRDFKTIRFLRMFMTNFENTTILRFGTLELVKGDWRVYSKDLNNPNLPPSENASISIATVNIEENGNKDPVNYVMPPGVNRMIDPGQPQLRMENEQSLAIHIENLAPGDARAIYRNMSWDTRQYRRLQMFVHAEKPQESSSLQDNEFSVFLRMGSDYKNNYYEYEIPLKLTPAGTYSQGNNTDRETVWPNANMFDFTFELMTNLKLKRNKEKRKEGSDVTYYTPYSEYDPSKPLNKITVVGNPSFSDVKIVMIGVRSNAKTTQSTEVWVDELRLTDFNEDGGWAANANLYLGLSDLGSVNITGRKETAGFGSLDQGIMDRNIDDKQSFNFSAQVELGKFFPEKAKVSIPVYFSYGEDVVSPKYNPLDQDILLKDALSTVNTKAERDSIKNFAQDKIIKRTLDISNVKVNITSKTPMPYDPSNFSLGFSNSEDMLQNAATQYERQVDMRFLLTYRYSNPLKPWKPFAGGGGKGNNTQTKPANTGTRPSQGRPANNAPKSNNPFKDFGINFLPQNISVGSNIQRNYFESQLRDINNMGENMIPASFREDFIWNRDLTVQWNLLTDLNLDLRTGTEARIDAPHVQVNKKYNYDDYGLWKDSVMQSIKNWGSPMDYAQQFSGTYAIPFKYIPVLNFIQANLKYSAEYHWDRGANINPEEDEPIELGNTIRNSRTIELNNVNLNLLNLYNKSKFLEEANKKFTLSNKPTNNSRNATKAPEKKKNEEDEKKKKKFEKEVQLRPDTTTDVIHSLNNKRIRITARGANGKLYTVKYKKIDANSIRIENKDTTKLQLVITQLPPLEDEAWYKYAQIAARGLMMVRTISFSYSETAGSMIPGFRPEIGDFFGQGSSPFGTTPGLDFAFGLTGEDYLEKASKNDWLVKNLNNSNPAMFDKNETFTLNATLEPFAGMKITLDAGRTKTHASEVYYMYDNATPKFNGTFMMTTIALKSAFEKVDAANGYYSRAFTNFLKNREVIAQRLNRVYGNAFADAGIPYSDISLNSSDVLVPAFFAAYTGRNVSTTDLSFFPALTSLLPNWKITYDGLIQLPIIKKYFKSFALEHKYECHYAIGSYNAYSVWSEITDGIGFIQNELSDRPSPSSPYNIMGVNIKESFNPLFGIRSSFLNNMSLNFSYGIERNVNLNIASYQIIELDDVNWKTDFGYRFENFNKILKLPKTGGENFNNDLNLSISANYRKTQNLIRMIQDADTQASKGDSQIDISLKADYNMSRMLTFQAFFDRKISTPLVSATAFPLSTTNFGISLKINLSR